MEFAPLLPQSTADAHREEELGKAMTIIFEKELLPENT